MAKFVSAQIVKVAATCCAAVNVLIGFVNSAYGESAGNELAVVGPFSGNLKNFGDQIHAGVEAAVDDANRRETDSSKRIRAVYLDDSCNSEAAVKIAKKVVDGNARAVLGHVCSVASMPASLVYSQAHLPMVTAASSNSAFTERGLQNVFRVTGRDDGQAPVAAQAIATQYGGKRLAIIQEADLTGRGHGERVAQELAKRGVQPVFVREIEGPQDIPGVMAQLTKENIQVVFYGGHQAPMLGSLIRSVNSSGRKVDFVSNDGAGNSSLWETAGDAAEGLLFTFDPDFAHRPEAASAVSSIRSEGAAPVGFTLNAYVAAQILIEALRANPTASAEDLIEYIHRTQFDTAIGPVRFDTKGDPVGWHEELFRWHDGKVVRASVDSEAAWQQAAGH